MTSWWGPKDRSHHQAFDSINEKASSAVQPLLRPPFAVMRSNKDYVRLFGTPRLSSRRTSALGQTETLVCGSLNFWPWRIHEIAAG